MIRNAIRLTILLACIFAAHNTTLAATVYVDSSATGTNDGTSWTNAFVDLSDALAAASSGDEVWVAQGTYMPNNAALRTALNGTALCTTYPTLCPSINSRAKSFVVPAGVSLLGGFSGLETSASQRTLSASATVLSGDFLSNDDPMDLTTRSDNALQVVLVDGSGSTSQLIDRLTVTAGHAIFIDPFFGSVVDDFSGGGGMVIRDGEVTLQDVVFNNNMAAASGGALAIISSADTYIENCTFQANSLIQDTVGIGATLPYYGNGGGAIIHRFSGLHSTYGAVVVTNSLFDNNSSTEAGRGGAIHAETVSGSSPTNQTLEITGCTFTNNFGGQHILAGNTYVEGASAIEARYLSLSDTTIASNTGGCAVIASVDATVVGCTFVENFTVDQSFPGSPNSAGALYVGSAASLSTSSFVSNRGESYGAVFAGPYSVIADCDFTSNAAAGLVGSGGGVYSDYYTTVSGCVFDSNAATDSGGGLYTAGSYAVFNVLAHDNTADLGGGIYIDDIGAPNTQFVNITVTQNSAAEGGGVYNDFNGFGDPDIFITNSIIWGNSDGIGGLSSEIAGSANPQLFVSHTLIEDPSGMFGGAGMLYTDPSFASPSTDDFTLLLNTPARDTGDNSALDLDSDSISDVPEDLSGGSRLQGATSIVDLGAFERCFADLDNSGSVNGFDNSLYLTLYGANDPEADIDNSGTWTFFDVTTWLSIYNSGTPCN